MQYTRKSLINAIRQSLYGQKMLLLAQKIGTVISTVWNFFRSHKNMVTIMIPIVLIIIGTIVYLVIRTVWLHYQFADASTTLVQTTMYDTREMQGFAEKYPNITDAVQGFANMSQVVDRYYQYLQSLQTPYTHFLQNILLPSLFIWTDPYSDQIDTSIVGRKFIEQNPFTDTALIQYWSDFFRNVGDGTDYILVKDMKLGTIKEGPELFVVPISVSFVAPSKRAFLLLVDKLSLTSQEATISLINQFFYHLWASIKSQNPQEDQNIGKSLYTWIYEDAPNTLVQTGTIVTAIQETVQCQLLSTQACLYTFRNTYRSIPQLAYGIGLQVDDQSIMALKRFIQQLPPLITIADFSFQKMPTRVGVQPQYEGSVVINMHGRSVTTQQVDQLSFLLGNKCIGTNTFLSPENALQTIDQYLRRIADTQIAQQQSTQLLQLRRIVDEGQGVYNTLSNYEKVIKLFELEKMLSDTGICRQ